MPRHSSREDDRPADLWFWDDWFASADVRLCSLAAQGLWISVLGYMARSERKGALLINGKQITSKDLATLTGKNEAEITALLRELEERGVFSKLPDGTIINRRMFRESELRRVRAAAGRLGGLSSKQSVSKAATKQESQKGSKPPATLEDEDEYEVENEDVISSKDKKTTEIIVEVIRHLNAKTGKRFLPGSAGTVKLIRGRLAEGRTLEDFKHVIDVKVAKWLGDPKMDAFLRPDTLFRPDNFESYLNERDIPDRRRMASQVGAHPGPAPTKAELAQEKAQAEAVWEEVSKEFKPKADAARAAGDEVLLRKIQSDADKAFERRFADIVYRNHELRASQGENRP